MLVQPTHDASTMQKRKHVRFSTITVYEFGVTIGGSAVPKHGGPSIGLKKKPRAIWKTTVDAVQDASLQYVLDSHEDKTTLKDKMTPRRRRVRWLKPLERVTMLTKAGCSEKRIYRMMMESSEIAMSRRLTLSIDHRVAV